MRQELAKGRDRALRLLALAAGATLVGAAAAAAEAPKAVEEIVVTGTRLPNPDQVANSPTMAVGETALQASGTLTLETALNRLPQVVPSYSSAANNPSANGATYVNLRGLGVARNLVLLNGRRAVGGDASGSVDLNTIPEPLIERVEIVTGGASAVYGADAVAGVVDVILKSRFDGLEFQGRTLVSERGDGQEHEVSLTAGKGFETGALMASVSWAKRDEIGKGARAFSAQADQPSGFLPNGGYIPAGPNAPSQAVVDAIFAGYGVGPGKVSNRGGVGGFAFNADGTLIATGRAGDPAFDAQNYRGPLDQVATRFYPDVYSFNFQPFNKLILPLDRTTAFVSGRFEPTSRITVYGRAMGARYTADTALAPTPAPTDENPLLPGSGVVAYIVPVTNPFIPPDLARLLASRRGNSPALPGAGPTEDFQYRLRAVSLGPRLSSNRAEVVNLLAGARAELAGDWVVEASAGWGRYARRESQDGLMSVRRMEQLLQSPTGGTEFCAGGFNPFGAGINDDCRKFLRVTARYSTRVTLEDEIVTASGTLARLPAGPLRAVFGLERRDADFRFKPPTGLTTGEVAGFTFLNALAGRIRTVDAFTEVAAPLFADRPWVKALDLTLGWRRSSEAHGHTVDTYKAELGWTIDPEFRLRSSVQRAVRAPDIFERFQPPLGEAVAGFDPCSATSAAHTAQVLALCRKQGAALGFQQADIDSFATDQTDVPVLHSGEADLQPERARTITAGVVWTPGWRSDWVGGLRAMLDWYDIEIGNAIGYLDPQLLLNACYNLDGSNPNLDPASPACARIVRSGGDFTLSSIRAPQTNQGRIAVSGIDAAVAFRTDLAALSGRRWLGALDASVWVGWLQRFEEQDSPIQPRYNFAGTIADSNTGYESLPRWKGLASLSWTTGPAMLQLSARYIDAMEHRLRRIGSDPTATGPGPAWYLDLFARWTLGRDAELRAGVLNLADRGPELFSPAVDAGTEPSTYDVVGRRYWLGLTLRY